MQTGREDVYTKVVRAGKRTYYFDVKSTRANDLFLTITERKMFTQQDGKVRYEKHKIFLYKEDFEKFVEALHTSLEELRRLRLTESPYKEHIQEEPPRSASPDGPDSPDGAPAGDVPVPGD